jgi:molybdate transport system substrate-binding protein
MGLMKHLSAVLIWLALAAAPAGAKGASVTVFAAASLRGVLEDIAAGYPDTLRFSYGGSGAMARQVAAGAPADLVILANPAWMAWLVEQGRVAAGHARIVTRNQLVLIAAENAPALPDIKDLPRVLGAGRLAIGQRDAVPAGSYARQWLRHAELWDALEPHLAETDNVRSALALVARGAVPFGVVYATDARADPSVRVRYQVPAGSHDPILYPAAAFTAAGADFLTYLNSAKAAAIFAAHGFGPPAQ